MPDDRRTTQIATFAAVALIAHQIGAKATRDALFLSTFAVTSLPAMLVAAAVTSTAFVFATARLLTRFGPARVVPWALVASAALLLGEWALSLRAPRLATVLFYLHMASLGAVLISAFWSLVNESLDPHSARRRISQIAAGGTLGGLMGGLLADRVGAAFGPGAMLLVLALLHLCCAALVAALGAPARSAAKPTATGNAGRSGFRVLQDVSYLRELAVLVLVATVAATLIDYVFKARATAAAPDGAGLLRFFAVFYTSVSVVTFIIQMLLGRLSLERLGLARSVATLPLVISSGGVLALLAPGVAAAGVARGLESVLRSSIFRSGYELFFTPVLAQDKRATKSIIDVGFERLGDAAGAGIVALTLAVAGVQAHSWLLGAAIFLGAVGLYIALRLHRGWVTALETSLIDQRDKLEAAERGPTVSAVMQTIAALEFSDPGLSQSGVEEPQSPTQPAPRLAPYEAMGPRLTFRAEANRTDEAIVNQLADLRSRDPARIRKVLAANPLPLELTGAVLPLLAWEEVCQDVIRALRPHADSIAGQLTDALVDPNRDFAIRRRVPRILYRAKSPRAVNGLVLGLDDRRFEVRYQCGQALASIRDAQPSRSIDRQPVLAAIDREVRLGERVWRGQRLLDELEGDESSGSELIDSFLRERTNLSLQHVFTLLSLIYPREPLKVAFRGLFTDDPALRGTSLEYLDSILPAELRDRLLPHLAPSTARRSDNQKPRDEILAELMRSNHSIELNLARLQGAIPPESTDT